MKVKIGNTVFDGEDEPIMVILSALDKQNIADMAEAEARYACWPKGLDRDEMTAWVLDDTHWQDAPHEEIAEIRVLEAKVKGLRAVIEVLESADATLRAFRFDELLAKGHIHPDQKCPCVVALKYCTGQPCDNCDC